MTGQWSPRFADGLTPRPAPPAVDEPDDTETETEQVLITKAAS